MTTISINENKYGYTIQRKNKTSLKFSVTNCTCILPIDQNKSMWFIKIKVPDDVSKNIIDIEKQANNIIRNYELLSSLDNDTCMNIKIPYRYKKFECEFFNKEDQRIISSDIISDDNLKINLECMNIWKNDKYFGLTWKTKIIKKM